MRQLTDLPAACFWSEALQLLQTRLRTRLRWGDQHG